MRRVGFGIIGCSGISNYFHIPDLKKIREAGIVALADTKPHRAETTARQFKVKSWYAD